jgi:3-oxoacyl-[acyl-carrier protein] reductase
MRLENRVAIVTGGARGIGQAVAELFAKEGAKVIIWDLLDIGEETAAGINANGGVAEFTKISVTDQEGILAETKRILDKHGQIDILINNAGITRDKSFSKMTIEDWNAVINVNLTSVFICTQAVLPAMREQNYGRIISASSTTGLWGNFGQTNYAAAKAGIIGMTKTWALELGKYGITANAIAPGFTLTEMTKAMPDAIIEGAKQQIPARMIADPIDIAYGYLYLASEEARFVTGSTLCISGGSVRH